MSSLPRRTIRGRRYQISQRQIGSFPQGSGEYKTCLSCHHPVFMYIGDTSSTNGRLSVVILVFRRVYLGCYAQGGPPDPVINGQV